MTKFKLLLKLKKGPVKCMNLIKSYLMDKKGPSTSHETTTGAKKKIRAHKKSDEKGTHGGQDVPNISSEEGFIPLAARDSKWVDLAFYNPNFQLQQEDEELDEEELQVVDVEGNLKAPMLILFPGLTDNGENSAVISNLASPSDVTKMLVGQKPDFSRMKSSKKLVPTEKMLTSVPEMPQEENESIDSSILSYSRKSIVESDPNEVHESEEEELAKAVRLKRRRRRSSTTAAECDSSLSMIIALRSRPTSKPKVRGNTTLRRKSSEQHMEPKSSHGSLGDDEND